MCVQNLQPLILLDDAILEHLMSSFFSPTLAEYFKPTIKITFTERAFFCMTVSRRRATFQLSRTSGRSKRWLRCL